MAKPSTVLLEFLTWFAWLAVFASVQSKICSQYPAIRGVCRKAYLFTMIVPILASVWLMARSGSGDDLFAVLNHAFGAGVFAQTFLRALVLLKWLVVSGIPHYVSLPSGGSARTLHAESDMAALMGVLSQALHKPTVAKRNRRE
jgi:hypothetical protein